MSGTESATRSASEIKALGWELLSDADWARVKAGGDWLEEDRSRFHRLPRSQWRLTALPEGLLALGAYVFDGNLVWVKLGRESLDRGATRVEMLLIVAHLDADERAAALRLLISEDQAREGAQREPLQLSQIAPWSTHTHTPTPAIVQVEGGELEVVDVGALDDAVYRFVRENYDELPGARDIMEIIAPLLRIRSPSDR